MNCVKKLTAALLLSLPAFARAGEADIRIPDLGATRFLGGSLSGHQILWLGLAVCALATVYGWWQYAQTRALPVHRSMAAVSDIIWGTCKTYLWQQGKFLAGLWVLIAG
jgi:K(+)-stimulated pyrophosphate-energized sodium pump